MPKFTLPIEKTDVEDKDSIGESFANLSLLRNFPKTKLPNSFFITYTGFEITLKNHWSTIENLLTENPSPELIEKTRSLLLSKIKLDPQLRVEIDSKIRRLKKPLSLTGNLVDLQTRHESQIFSSTVSSEKDFHTNLIAAYTSFLQPEIVKKLTAGKSLSRLALAVMVAEKINPEVSGRAEIDFWDKNKIRIRSGWGEYHKDLSKDVCLINKAETIETSYFIFRQTEQLAFIKGAFIRMVIADKYQNQRKLSPEQALSLAQILKKLETKGVGNVTLHFEISQNWVIPTKLEFNTAEGKIRETVSTVIDLPLIKTLKPIFPGIISATSKLITKKSDLKKIKPGEIAIVSSINKNNLAYLKKAGGIIINTTDNLKEAQKTLLRNLGISSVIGKLQTLPNSVITVDSRTGNIFQGAFSPARTTTLTPRSRIEETKINKTATKIFAKIPYSDSKLNFDFSPADGIGPVLLENFSLKTITETLKFLTRICDQASGKPVLVQFSATHPNPTEHILSQAKLIKELRNKAGFKNLNFCLPAQKKVSDFVELKKSLAAVGLHRSPTLKLLLRLDFGANIFSLEQLAQGGLDGFLLDYWSLVNNLYQKDFSYTELVSFQDSAITTALEKIIGFAKKNGLFTLVYNFPTEKSESLSRELIQLGAKALATSWQLVPNLRKEVYQAEHHLVSGKN